MVKTKQTKRKSEAEKERRDKYRIAKVPPKFGITAKVVTHDPPMLQGWPGSTRNLPYYKGKYFIQSKLNTVYVKGVEIKIHVPVICLLMSKGVSNKMNQQACSGNQHPFPKKKRLSLETRNPGTTGDSALPEDNKTMHP